MMTSGSNAPRAASASASFVPATARTVCVVYNGEIYNFQSLVTELMALGINPPKPCSSASSYR
jgi:hypothetical protein